MIELNVVSFVRLARRAVRAMSARGSGRILITSSIAAEAPNPFEAVYGGTKAFLTSFAEEIRIERRDSGATVTALEPGTTDTPIIEKSGLDNTAFGKGPTSDAADIARVGFEALMAGKDKVWAGSTLERALMASHKIMPDAVKAALTGKGAKPGSA